MAFGHELYTKKINVLYSHTYGRRKIVVLNDLKAKSINQNATIAKVLLYL